jgi:hypothetical protein
MITSFSLAEPVRQVAPDMPDRRRFPHSGPKVQDSMTVEIQDIKTKLNLTTKVLASSLSAFDGIETSPETLQAYIQGYIASRELIEKMLLRMQLFYQAQDDRTKRFSTMKITEIIDYWFDKLNFNLLDESCPWRKLSKITGKHHSTLFRWYQADRKPRSVETILEIDKAVSEYIKAHPV